MIEKTKIYKVTVSGAEIDNLRVIDYSDFDPENTAGSEEDYLDKAIAHFRYTDMMIRLQKGLDDAVDIKGEGGNSTTIPSSIEFKLVYTQPDGLWVEGTEEDFAEDPEIKRTRDGRVLLLGSKAIKRLIAQALVYSHALSDTAPLMVSFWNPQTCGLDNTGHIELRNVAITADSANIAQAEGKVEVVLPEEDEEIYAAEESANDSAK